MDEPVLKCTECGSEDIEDRVDDAEPLGIAVRVQACRTCGASSRDRGRAIARRVADEAAKAQT